MPHYTRCIPTYGRINNKDYWESAQGPSLFGLLGVSFKRAWLNWVKEGVLSGDGWADEYGHFHKGKLKQGVRSDQALDYIANHEKTGPRSARRPDCSDYDGDVENAHGFYKWEAETGKREQIETDAYRTAPQEIETAQRLVNISDADPTNDGNPEIAVTRRCWRNLWLYKRPSSLGLGDFEEWIDPEVDIQRTFDHVYGVTKPSPVLLYQLPTATVHQPNGFVRIGARRAAQRAKRDAEDRETAVHQDTGDDDGRARGTPPPAGRVPPAVRARLPGRRPGLRQPGRLAPEARFSFRDRVAALPPPEAAGRAESALAAPHAHIGAAGRRGAAAGGLRAPWPFLDPHDPGNLRSHDPWPGRRCGRFGGKTTDRKSTR